MASSAVRHAIRAPRALQFASPEAGTTPFAPAASPFTITEIGVHDGRNAQPPIAPSGAPRCRRPSRCELRHRAARWGRAASVATLLTHDHDALVQPTPGGGHPHDI